MCIVLFGPRGVPACSILRRSPFLRPGYIRGGRPIFRIRGIGPTRPSVRPVERPRPHSPSTPPARRPPRHRRLIAACQRRRRSRALSILRVPSLVANRESNRWVVPGTPLGRRGRRDGFDAAVVASVARRGRLRCRSSLILPIGLPSSYTLRLRLFARASCACFGASGR